MVRVIVRFRVRVRVSHRSIMRVYRDIVPMCTKNIPYHAIGRAL